MAKYVLLISALCLGAGGSRCNDARDTGAAPQKQAPSGKSKEQASKPEGPRAKDQKDAEAKKEQEPAFEIVVDENFHRPGFRRTPPADSNGDKPLDVVKRFLESTSKGDFQTARKCVRLSRDRPLLPSEVGRPVPSVGEELFPVFCEKMRNYVKSVTLSGSTIKQKGGYWSIRYKLKNTKGQEEGTFYLTIVEKRWTIEEKPHWMRIAKEDIAQGEYSLKGWKGEPVLPGW